MAELHWWRRLRAQLLHRLAPPEQPGPARMWFSGRTAAGVHVDADAAMANACVWACVQYLTKTIAMLPWHVHRDTGRGHERQSSHPADWLLYRRPCPDYSAFDWRRVMGKWVLLHGNAYAEIERDGAGRPYALWPIHPARVTVGRDEAGALRYEVWNDGGRVVVPSSDMFHVRGLGDGTVGLSVIEYAAESIGWAQATQLFGATYFGEGMNPSGLVEVANGLTPAAADELRQEMRRVYAGPRGERLAILDAGMKFHKVQQAPDESQFIETRQHQVEEICRWFGVPPHKVMHMLRSTFSNIEHQSIEVVVDTLTPLAKAFEEEADYKLLRDNRGGLYTKIDMRGLMRGDHASRSAYYAAAIRDGWMSRNEVRALEDLNPVSGGDVFYISQNMQPVGQDGLPVREGAHEELPALVPIRENGSGRRLPN